MIQKSADAMCVIFSFLPEIQTLKLQNLSRQFYDRVLTRLHYSCHVEWRQNPRAIAFSETQIRIEQHEPIETGLEIVSAVMLNHYEVYFSYRRP